MAFGLVLGHQEGKEFISVAWNPAETTPSDALKTFIANFPEATTFSIVETQCDGSIRPVMSGHVGDLPREFQPPCCDSCFGLFARHEAHYGITGGIIPWFSPSKQLHYDCAHMWADNINQAVPSAEVEVSVFKVTR